MMRKFHRLAVVILLISILLTGSNNAQASFLPEGFVYATDFVPNVILEMRYFSAYNFVGARVEGYWAPLPILTRDAALALKQANEDLLGQGYMMKIFDAYRPQGAYDHFVRWAQDVSDVSMREYFYPDIPKNQILPQGYIAKRADHSRGSTVYVSIMEMNTGLEVDMGSPFDFFGPISAHNYEGITAEQKANRLILKTAMEKAGFESYSKEWWHYTLKNEPFPTTYFNFPVMRSGVVTWPTAPSVNTTLPKGTAGKSYSLALGKGGTAPITWSLESGSLPNGLSLTSTGVITGTPTTDGTFNFTIKAANVMASNIESLSITIKEDCESGCNVGFVFTLITVASLLIVFYIRKVTI